MTTTQHPSTATTTFSVPIAGIRLAATHYTGTDALASDAGRPVVVLAHGLGHVLFLAPSLRVADWAGQTAHSWLLTGTLGDGIARGVGVVIWSATIALFVAGVAGWLADASWWRAATVAGSIVSIVGIVLFWDGLATGSAAMALAFDVVLLVALLVAHWPAGEAVGA